MPYSSGAVATVSAMPVPSASRFSAGSYRLSSSLSSPSYYTSEYRSKYSTPSSSTSSVAAYGRRHLSLSEADSGLGASSRYSSASGSSFSLSSSSSRERSEARETAYSRASSRSRADSGATSASASASAGSSAGVSGGRAPRSSTAAALDAVQDLYNKYSPSAYLAERPPRATAASTTAQRYAPAVAATRTEEISASPRLLRGYSRTPGNERGGLAGLRNIGNTCFMNSVIQCLSNTKPLLEYLLNDGHLTDINTTVSGMKGALIKAFTTVIQELWHSDSNGTVVNTTALKSQIQRFAPRFMGYSQQDAQEFLRYLLEGLHEDVNRVTVKPKPILTEIDETLSDQQKSAEAWKRYLRADDSKIVDIFVGQLKSTLRCTVCGHCSVTFDPFWDLSLPIPVRTGQVRLQQCLDSFTREEVLDGDEKPTCSKCQMRRKCTKSFTIQKFPKILVLHLKRFSPTERFRGKLNVTVDFPLTGLDLSAYAANRGQGCTYNLYGVANHSGTTYSGHYTAYCKHPYTGEWHEYNDSRVSTISSRSIMSSEAYVLFYELFGHTSHL
ncbi:ubiquitin carboxyl-terminal hydrolase 2-like isoform X2 [Schistocerca americana]|nr:ubiquitin carboxyl-terminal hydrolase 2-like isoform X2 [Schistocerca americana]XP_046980376.1 ubiquitin carboxyl-terminal hydrolase 2-like isoform X2 [Schistocerca americana]XP_046980377.1 ubiquitin carboxyl-terminal hydrolase 2-like isoform X2 [Schistocerca americana]XP_046980378.1 ubiquitin carboxyl-terminal hydrolase 2-like isoform X2 [Schistocerca americana]XP_046980380.1 ubiquitin carboxyl-terminal hydrolase 2-like isoform X2 [Schistocerca americana]